MTLHRSKEVDLSTVSPQIHAGCKEQPWIAIVDPRSGRGVLFNCTVKGGSLTINSSTAEWPALPGARCSVYMC